MSNPSLTDVQARRAEIKSEREVLRERDQGLVAEDQDLAVAERALLRLAGTTAQEMQVYPDDGLGSWYSSKGWLTPLTPRPVGGTQEQYTVWLLEGSVDPWATANQIQAGLNHFLERPVPMSSVSPMLTAMKNKGTIVRDNLKVALASRVKTNKAAAE